jgi:hypothetical protein
MLIASTAVSGRPQRRYESGGPDSVPTLAFDILDFRTSATSIGKFAHPEGNQLSSEC